MSYRIPIYPLRKAEITNLIMVKVIPFKKEFFKTLASVLSKLDIDGKFTKVIKDKSLLDFVRMNLSVASNSYIYNIFPDSSVMSSLTSKKAKNEFIAFRKKYMNISNKFLFYYSKKYLKY